MFTHSRYARPHMKNYEVSSKGDKRFSALYATLSDGRTIEEAFQLDVKGYRKFGDNWKLGKGKKPLDLSIDTWKEYKNLWKLYLDENPNLVSELLALNEVNFTDMFASTPTSQARALAELLNELNPVEIIPMKEFNPMQYLAIDIANQFGLDKLNFEDRINWVKTNEKYLEDFQDKAEEPILYYKAVKALRDVQSGRPIGHTVALDACCSGLQIMSALMRCKSGAMLTGLIDPHNRKDAYTELTDALNAKLETSVKYPRKDSKRAVMTAFYGSKVVPQEVFGDNVDVFYEVLEEECTGAWELNQTLIQSWNKRGLNHSWYLPDGHYAYCPVMETVSKRVNLSDWDYTPVMQYKENMALKFGLSNSANAIHSVDSYVLRTMVRRCNYKPKLIKQARQALLDSTDEFNADNVLNKRYEYTKMADIADLETITNTANELDKELKDELVRIFDMVLSHEPFDIICIHDSFATHPNHCNQLRFHYKEILAELSDSTVIDDILNQLYGDEGTVDKGDSISQYIRSSNYGLS